MFKYILQHKTTVLILSYSLIFLLIRLILLDQTFMLHDERDIVYSGWSLAKSGKDLYGNFFPFSFNGISPDNPLFSIWFSAIGSIFIPATSVFAARFPFVLASTSLPILFFLLSFVFTKNRRFSLIFMIISTLNPWMFHLSRYAMDITIALPIMILAIIMLLKNKRLIAYVLLFLTCFNYQGFRLVIPFILFISEVYLALKNSSKLKFRSFIPHIIFIFFLLFSILIIDRQVTMSRTNQVIFLNKDKFASKVNDNRRLTLAPLTVSKYFDNKLVENIRYSYEAFVNGLNTELFFFQGDRSATNGTGIGGLLFISTLPFFLYGLISLRKKSYPYYFLSSFILWGMIPSIASLNGHSYGIRGSLMIVGYATLITIGLLEIWAILNKYKIIKYALFCLFGLVYILDTSFFAYNYFLRRPIMLGEMYSERERTLYTKISGLPANTKVIIFDNEPKNLLISYMFLHSTPIDIVQKVLARTIKKDYHIDNISFFDCDNNWKSISNNKTVFISNRCLLDKEYNALQDMELKSIYYTDTPLIAFFIINNDLNIK